MPPSMADWSLLPTELLQQISQKLNSDFYLLRFRSVCSTWRSSIPNYRPKNNLPLKIPLPSRVYTDDDDCYILKHSIFLIKPTTIPIPHQPQQILQPMLIRIGPNLNGKTQLWHPLNLDDCSSFDFPNEVAVFDFNHISVVDLGYVFVLQSSDPYPDAQMVDCDKVVTATYPAEQQPHFLTFNYLRHPCMLQLGDDDWMEIDYHSTCDFGDICNFKGRMFVANNKGKTVMVEPDLSVDLVAAKVSYFGRVRLCLAESELLLVDTLPSDTGGWMDVYRLDEKEKKWVELSNLGDRVLFLGRKCSFSASASDLGFANGNCVINMEVSGIGCGICDLNLDENEILPLSDYPDYYDLLEASGLDDEELDFETQSDEDEESEDEDGDEDEDEESEEEEDEESEEEEDEDEESEEEEDEESEEEEDEETSRVLMKGSNEGIEEEDEKMEGEEKEKKA